MSFVLAVGSCGKTTSHYRDVAAEEVSTVGTTVNFIHAFKLKVSGVRH